jgi:peptidoglycan L-alanyl-D-glutamate endopeptidase CwlK
MKINIGDLLHIATTLVKQGTPVGAMLELAEGVGEATGVIHVSANGELIATVAKAGAGIVAGNSSQSVGARLFEKIPDAASKAPPKFVLGKSSLSKFNGVKESLVQIVQRAIEITTQDFTVFEGLRTVERQRTLVATHMSKTMKSKHITGDAVDLVPYIDGAPKWDWDGCYKIACAMGQAALELGVADKLVWGAVWDAPMSHYGFNADNIKGAVEAYKERHPGPDFLDGPHFQLGF